MRNSGNGDWTTDYLLQRAYTRLGQGRKAEKCSARIRNSFPEIPGLLAVLLDEGVGAEEWNEVFYSYSGYEPEWLEERAGRKESFTLREWFNRAYK